MKNRDLGSLKGFDIKNIGEQKEKLDSMILAVKESGVDIDLIVKSIIGDYRIRTENSTKAFYRISKKGNSEKSQTKFVKDKLLPIWKNCVESKEENVADFRNLIDNREFAAYMVGIYIGIHSRNLSENIIGFLTGIIAEMAIKASIEINKKRAK